MTLLHTKGYAEVLESVKERAEKKAAAMARKDVVVTAGTIMRQLWQMCVTQVLLAADQVEADHPGFSSLTDEECETIHLTFAEDFLHHYRYELERVWRGKAE